MNPPFYGTRVVTDIELDEIYPLIDTRALFVGQWRFKHTSESETAKAWPAFEEWKKRCIEEKILEPKAVYGYFKMEDFKSPLSPLCKGGTRGDFIPLQLVTVGRKVVDKCQWLFASHKYTDYLYLHGLAVVTTEALAEYWHKKILRELGIPFNADKKLPTGSRISPGYPAWPNLGDQEVLVRLLEAEKISVEITETYQLIPEYSTSAMIVLS